VDSCHLSNETETETGKHDLVRSPFQDKYKGHSLSDKDGHLIKSHPSPPQIIHNPPPTVAT